jgi:hypothetical protein
MSSEENIVLSENNSQPAQLPQVKLVDVNIVDENTALNVMVSFLSIAQKRGAFNIDESAKIWECIKMFQRS